MTGLGVSGLSGGTAFAAVFGAGLLASLSPCVYPLLPITLGFIGTQAQGRRRQGVLAYASGQVAALVALGAFAVLAGESLGFSSESPAVCLGTGLLLLVAGLVSLSGRLPAFLSRVGGGGGGVSPRGLLGAFALGVGSALVASPCTSPILAGVLALMASSQTVARGLALMLCYSLGFSALFVLLGLGLLRLGRLPRSGPWLTQVHRLSSLLLLGAGVYWVHKAF